VCDEKLEAVGKKVLLLIWDNASWHISHELSAGSASTTTRSKRAGEE
jgi:hypothetical protein